MSIGTAIVIAAAWAYAAATRLAPKVTDLGIKRGAQRAWMLTAIAVAFETASLLLP